MIKKIIFCAALSIMPTIAQTTSTVLELPSVSVIGNIMASSQESQTDWIELNELEFAFQHYLYPSVKADVFLAMHKGESGTHELALEEGYVTFLDALNMIHPSIENTGIGVIVGKKLIPFGRLNALHFEQQPFIDRPLGHQHFFGSDHGVAAEGGMISGLLPLPIFSQIDIGYWTASEHDDHSEEHEDDHSEEHTDHGVAFENRLFNARIWNAIALSKTQEFEFGASYILGNASADHSDDQPEIIGVDVTYNQTFKHNQSLQIHSEYTRATYGDDGEAKETQSAAFIGAKFAVNQLYSTGLRYDMLGAHGDEGEDYSQWSFLVERQLTETSKFRLQYNTSDSDDIDNTVTAQFMFGMGPHAHVLQ